MFNKFSAVIFLYVILSDLPFMCVCFLDVSFSLLELQLAVMHLDFINENIFCYL